MQSIIHIILSNLPQTSPNTSDRKTLCISHNGSTYPLPQSSTTLSTSPSSTVEPHAIAFHLTIGKSFFNNTRNIKTRHLDSINPRMHTPTMSTLNSTRFIATNPYHTKCMPSPCTIITTKIHDFVSKQPHICASPYFRHAQQHDAIPIYSFSFSFLSFLFSLFYRGF